MTKKSSPTQPLFERPSSAVPSLLLKETEDKVKGEPVIELPTPFLNYSLSDRDLEDEGSGILCELEDVVRR